MNVGDAVSWNVKGAFTVPRFHRYSCLHQESGTALSGTVQKISRTRALVVSKRGIVWSVALINLTPSPNGVKAGNEDQSGKHFPFNVGWVIGQPRF